ncbi:hypothetical protein U9M48_026191 [Paspalum notatum var. saurae]|uniref:Uncharacterized protein n=1 Tax=Paspalum notatum var. saurae TaxID=547442 RepID=A0AAQ3TUS9_PASNO
MKLEGTFIFRIQFEHLLIYNKDAAIAICSQQSRIPELLRPVVSQFLSEEELLNIAENLEIIFMSMPQSIKKLTDFINANGGKLVRTEILAGNREECVALDLGMMLFQSCAAEVFRAHKLGLSWDGDLDPEDIVVINEDEVRITKIPMPGNGSKKVRDVRKVGDLFMPKFVKGEKTALYFTILKMIWQLQVLMMLKKNGFLSLFSDILV